MALKLGMISIRYPTTILQAHLNSSLKLLHNTASVYEVAMDNTPRRAVMYCPGDDMRKIKKGLSSKADCIVLDCEDGVAMNKKEAARSLIKSVLDSNNIPDRPEVAVRVNSVDSGLCEDDLAAVLSATLMPKTLFLPKVESVENLQWEQLGVLMVLKYYMPGNIWFLSLRLLAYKQLTWFTFNLKTLTP